MSEEWREWMAERALRRTAEGIAREVADGWTCEVRHPDAGGKCERPSTLTVYGIHFCAEHGAEARAGALNELYFDAEQTLERLDNPAVGDLDNGEVLKAIEPGASALAKRFSVVAREEDELLVRAYPLIRERIDPDIVAFDYSYEARRARLEEPPEAWYRTPRLLLCKLMRLAYAERASYIVEALEPLRESVSAQLAFALQDAEERYGPARAGRREGLPASLPSTGE